MEGHCAFAIEKNLRDSLYILVCSCVCVRVLCVSVSVSVTVLMTLFSE
jgi:hypothetical protein